jgi:riboflavin kinase/FMN adenylyltransferase
MIKIQRLSKKYTEYDGILSLGNFDGIHLGHQHILKKNVADARRMNMKSYVLTFAQHPAEVLSYKIIHNLSSPEKKYQLFEQLGINAWFCIPFDLAFSKMKPEAFIKYLRSYISVKKIIVGANYFFGANKSGSTETLCKLGKKYGFEIEIVRPLTYNGHIISSSFIRESIKTGHIERANHLIGRTYSISGTVVSGNSIGRTIGFPTANIAVNNMCIPRSGVYFVYIILEGKKYRGIANIGYKPTVSDHEPLTIEVHILEFDENIYQKKLSVFFIKRLRDEKKFDSIDTLKQKISDDINSIITMENNK